MVRRINPVKTETEFPWDCQQTWPSCWRVWFGPCWQCRCPSHCDWHHHSCCDASILISCEAAAPSALPCQVSCKNPQWTPPLHSQTTTSYLITTPSSTLSGSTFSVWILINCSILFVACFFLLLSLTAGLFSAILGIGSSSPNLYSYIFSYLTS